MGLYLTIQYVLPFKPRQFCSALTVFQREELISAVLCYPVSSTLTYRQLLNRSLGMFQKNTVNARESCICSVMTDIIKQFSLCCNWFNIGGISLLAAHACILPYNPPLSSVMSFFPRPLVCYQGKKRLEIIFHAAHQADQSSMSLITTFN